MSEPQRRNLPVGEIDAQGSDRSPRPDAEQRDPVGKRPRKDRWRPVSSAMPAWVRKGA
jgi:hypothetical protein